MSGVQLFFVVLAVAALVGAAFALGRRGHRSRETLRLEEYDFYPFVANDDGLIEFRPDLFLQAVDHFLRRRNRLASGELVVIGEQNFVRDTLSSTDLARYKAFYDSYDGDAVISDNATFLENYRRIVRLIGRSFPNAGIEILLHDLVNPSKSVIEIENGEVTGRAVGGGTTNLVLDLKTRRSQGQDKLNYELAIGARRFKCTTIPIFRPEYGLVGAICINVDARFMREHVMGDRARLEAFFDNLLQVDMRIDENILSKAEYLAATSGKRHYLDEAIRTASTGDREDRRLAAIVFSDIVDYTRLMETDERAALGALETNLKIHRSAVSRNGGRVLKEMGDGLLLWFDSVAKAVAAARDIQGEVELTSTHRVRIGIHLGEVVEVGGDVFGDGVNVASRIHGEAEPGSIVISEVVADNIRNQPGTVVTPLGERSLKHISNPIRLYLVEP